MADFKGTNNDDVWTGDGTNETATGGFGNDTLSGGGGNDAIFGEFNLTTTELLVQKGDLSGPRGTTRVINNSSTSVFYYTIQSNGGITQIAEIPAGATVDVEDFIAPGGALGNEDRSFFYDIIKNAGETGVVYTVNPANDTINGGDGDDRLYGMAGDDIITGGAGNDTIEGNVGKDTLSGDAGSDLISGADGDDTISGGAGDDELYGGNGTDKVTGDAGADLIYGGGGDDIIYGGDAGASTGDLGDTIYGEGGDDTIYGNLGDDVLSGSLGEDALIGDVGNDTITGGTGNDVLDGGAGDDTLTGDPGNDTISGGLGADTIRGDSGIDTIDGGDGADVIYGGSGGDSITGGAGDDTIYGNAGLVNPSPDILLKPGQFVNNTIPGGGQLDGQFVTYDDLGKPVTYAIRIFRGYDGRIDVFKFNNDGTLTPTDTIQYDNSTLAFSSSSDPDLATKFAASQAGQQTGGVAILGNALETPKFITTSTGTNYLFQVSGNGSGVSVWELTSDGTLDFQAGIKDGNSGSFSWRESSVYEDSNGDIHIYAPRRGEGVISEIKFDPDTKLFESTGTGASTTLVRTDYAVDVGATTSTDVITVGGKSYVSASDSTGLNLFEINLADGSLTKTDYEVATSTANGNNHTNNYLSQDGQTGFVLYSNRAADEIVLFKIDTATGSLIETSRIQGQGDLAYAESTYLEGVPIVVLPDSANSIVRLYSIDNDGNLTLQSEIDNYPNSGFDAPLITTSNDGTNYLYDTLSGLSVELNFEQVTGQDDDVIDGGAGVDTIYAEAGDDVITVSGGDSAFGGDDRDLFVIDGSHFADGNVITIDGGTGSTAPNDIDDFDVIKLTGFSVVPGTSSRTEDEVGVPTLDNFGNASSTKSYTGTVQVTDGTNIYTINYSEIESIICFARGTQIKTFDGTANVEDIKAGDIILTKDNGYKPVQWIGSRALNRLELELNPKLNPIRIKAGSLGAHYPETDLYVSPQHRILLKSKIAERMFGASEVLVGAKQLLMLDGVDYVTDFDEVEYFHILLDQHEIIFANGAEAETLFTGPEALKSVSEDAKVEILTLFPELLDMDYDALPVRRALSGRLGRKLVHRHLKNDLPVYQEFIL